MHVVSHSQEKVFEMYCKFSQFRHSEPDDSFVCIGPPFLPQALIEAHDQVATKCYEMPVAAVNSEAPVTSSLMPAEAVRIIGIQKKAGEPLVSEPGIYLSFGFPVGLLIV